MEERGTLLDDDGAKASIDDAARKEHRAIWRIIVLVRQVVAAIEAIVFEEDRRDRYGK